MKLLLLGSSGFIGNNFLELAPKDIKIIGIYNKSKSVLSFVKEKKLNNVKLYKCDLTNSIQVNNLINKIGGKFDYCIFLAANVNIPLSKSNPFEDLKANVGSLINFLDSCDGINKFVYMSTAGVYDGIKGEARVNAKLDPVVPYCISKLMAEQYVKYFSSIGFIKDYTILRFGGAFGKYSNKFLTKLVEDIYIKEKKVIEIYGDGTNIINVMYTKDVVRALVKCLKSNKKNVLSNFGSENMTITQVVSRVAKIFNKNVKIKYTPKIKKQKYITFKIDADFNRIFNFKPKYSFEAGIKEFGDILKNES